MQKVENEIQYFSPAQASDQIPGRPCTETVYRWIASGQLEAVRVGRRLFVPATAIEAFLRSPVEEFGGTGCGPSKKRAAEIEALNKKLESIGS